VIGGPEAPGVVLLHEVDRAAQLDPGVEHDGLVLAEGVLLAAIEKVATTNAGGDLVIDREALIKAVRSTKDFKGLSGKLTCDPKGECGAGEVQISILKGETWQPLKSYTVLDLSGAPVASGTMAATMMATASK